MSSVRNTLRAARSALAARQWQRARDLFAQIVESNPRHAEALDGVGRALLGSGAVDTAIAWYERALARDASSAELSRGLGAALAARGSQLLARGRIEQARATLEHAVARAPSDAGAQQALGRACLADGYLEPAAEAFETSLKLLPKNATTRVWLSDVHSAAGDRAAAERELREALRQSPKLGQAWLRLAHLKRFRSADDADLTGLQKLARDPGLDAEDREAVELALGKALDDLGEWDEAFSHLDRAHALHRERQPFDTSALLGLMDRIESVCDAHFFERCRDLGSSSELPVFVVGLPRCGSTLVEQIIAAHPRAYGVGELRALPRLTADLPAQMGERIAFPDCLKSLDAASAGWLGEQYLARLARDAPRDVLRVCDKMLSNLLLIGLLAVVFPKARVIHVRRNPMDTALSIYMQSFSGSGVGYAHSLDDIGRYWARAERLMAHWKRSAPIAISELDYESLVAEPEAGVRAVLAAAGLEFDPRCLASHEGARQVRTVSNWQVRQPIHTRSVARWKNYERQLAPLAKYVDPTAG